jgi:inorganic pyrophosphatase/exopolyphosphatase
MTLVQLKFCFYREEVKINFSEIMGIMLSYFIIDTAILN